MGMTIDKAIENNKNLRMYMEITDKESENKFLKENYEALDMLIDIAQKYKKIEQIVNSNPDYIHHTDMDTYKLNSISEVVEDGKIDCN